MNHKPNYMRDWLNVATLNTSHTRRHVGKCVYINHRPRAISANKRHMPNVEPMLGHSPRRWPNIDPALGGCIVFAGI